MEFHLRKLISLDISLPKSGINLLSGILIILMLKKNWPINFPKIYKVEVIRVSIMEVETLHLVLEAIKPLDLIKASEAIKADTDNHH
jgi:hypothetical protein